jgi:hypothetical protein
MAHSLPERCTSDSSASLLEYDECILMPIDGVLVPLGGHGSNHDYGKMLVGRIK